MQRNLAPPWCEVPFVWPPLSHKWGDEIPEVGVYNLEHQPTTFDFVTWLVLATSLGCKSVRFTNIDRIQTWKYSKEIALKRFENILEPSCDLMNIPYSIGENVEGFTCGYHAGQINKYAQKYGIKKIPQTDTYKGHVTVTIRDSIRFKSRDSDRAEWNKVIDHLEKTEKVIVLEDCEDKPLPIAERMKLYSGAKMNFSVNNGPNSLLYFTDNPYLTFKMIPPGEGGKMMREHLMLGGFPENSQFCFKNINQEIVWKPDTFETIIKSYERISG